MSVPNIRINGAFFPLESPRIQRTQPGEAQGSNLRGRDDSYRLRLKGDYQGFKEIQAIKARLNEISERMQGSVDKEEILEKIKEGINRINKFFPPYPPGSEDRVRFLKGYVAFRVLIERLSLPPDTIDMTEEDAYEKSILLKDTIGKQGKDLSTNKEAIQYIVNDSL